MKPSGLSLWALALAVMAADSGIAAAQIVPAAPVKPAAPAGPVDAETEAARHARILAKTHEVARCLVRDLRPLVKPLLQQAPGSFDEQLHVAQLRRRGLRCVETASNVKDGALYIASWDIAVPALRGALAEALFEADFGAAGAVRPDELARVAPVERTAPEPAPQNAPAGADLTDVRRFAACAVRSAPEDSAGLMASEPGSPAETGIVRRLVREFDGCFPSDGRRSLNVPTVRGLVAEALYRDRSALARGEPLGPGGKVERALAAKSGAVVIVPVAAAAGGAAGTAGSYGAKDVRTLIELSRCIARQRPADTQELLSMDYREAGYDRMARWVASRSMTCVPRGRLRFSRLLFAGGLAEEMLAASPDRGRLSANVSASVPETEPGEGDITQAIGFCIVRSQPESVARLLATAPASAEENRVVRDLTPHIARCVAPGRIARISQPSLRAVAAVAAYRLVQQAAEPRPGRS